jgi:hypothetical protein
MDPEVAFDQSRLLDASLADRAERARRAGDPVQAVHLAREALGHGEDAAARAALALALLDVGDLDEARHTLEALLEALGGETHASAFPGEASFASHPAAMIPDTTLAAATAATLELVDAFDDASFERAIERAEAERELMLDADGVAEQVLREIPIEPPDEILPAADSPFATRTFAQLLERQGHEAEAESLRSTLATRPEDEWGADPEEERPPQDERTEHRARMVATLEQWLENLERTAT